MQSGGLRWLKHGPGFVGNHVRLGHACLLDWLLKVHTCSRLREKPRPCLLQCTWLQACRRRPLVACRVDGYLHGACSLNIPCTRLLSDMLVCGLRCPPGALLRPAIG